MSNAPVKLKWYKRYLRRYRNFLHTNELMSFRWPSLSEENDDCFKDFCNLFTFYLCTMCYPRLKECHPQRDDWVDCHHNAELLRRLSKTSELNLFEGLMAAYTAYTQIDDKTFLEDTFAKALSQGHPELDRTSGLFRAAQTIYEHQSETFICHGIEYLEAFKDNPTSIFPPYDSLHEKSLSKNRISYAIDTDRLPLIYCASDHGKVNSWDYCRGIIPKSKFMKLGGKILLAPDREHFYAESNIAIDQWCFIYFRKARRKKGLGFDIHLMREQIASLRANNIPVIEFETLQAFLRTLSLLQQKLEIQDLMDERSPVYQAQSTG